MSWDDFKTPVKKEVLKELPASHTLNYFYAVFNIGDKYKTINSLAGFQKHCERENEVKNADTSIKNEILIGNSNVVQNVKNYVSDIKIRKNAVVARSLIMTASPDFFKGMSEADLNHWKDDNVKFLKDNFSENCQYAVLHRDEKTWHIHALIVPKFKNKKGENILSNTRYFDGIAKMRAWQDNYSSNMKVRFKCLNRGIKYSKRTKIELKTFYALIKQNYNEKDIKQLAAKAKNSELLEIKIKAIQKTLEVYKNYNSKNSIEKDNAIIESRKLIKDIEKLKENEDLYKEALSILSQQYKIPQYAVKEAIKFAENINNEEKENEVGR